MSQAVALMITDKLVCFLLAFIVLYFLIPTKKIFSGWTFNQVLVDAECTHDGSFRHIQKFEQWGWRTLQQRVLDAQRTDTLTDLQATKPLF